MSYLQDLVPLRRLALSSQGLLQDQAYGRGLAGARNAINHLGYVQIDSLSVIERAHHHILHSRVPDFKPEMTNQILRNGDIFEYWTHAAALIPIHDFRFSLPYKHAIKSGQSNWYKNPDRKLMGELLERIRLDGPIKSRDLETNSKRLANKPSSSNTGWWDWKPAKKALEQLYMEGEIMVCDRDGFQKTYDLCERVLPSKLNVEMPSMEEFATHILDQQLRCHGFVSMKGITYQRRNSALTKAVKTLVKERLAHRNLEEIQISSGEKFILEPGAFERPSPNVKNRMLILSPFDNSVIQRDRLAALFQYDFRLECYLPEAKRKYGYFCLPLLYQDQFIGRMDCKAYRKTNHLEIKALHFENHHFDEHLVITAFIDAITEFSNFQTCNTISLIEVYPKHISQALHHALSVLEIER